MLFPGDDERDVTIKPFPNWGDADDLVDMMDVRMETEDRYSSVARSDWRRPVVEASQMLGQTIVAATEANGRPSGVSASLVVMRPADSRFPMTFHLATLTHGRTFSTVHSPGGAA